VNYPSAIQVPGPRDKLWPDRNLGIGAIAHSEEGYEPYGDQELADESIPLSWHFTVRDDGVVEQHYDLTDCPWHAGSHEENRQLIGVEHVGKKGEPLTPLQLAASVALFGWIGQQCGWVPSRTGQKTLWEHNEVPGASTTCPNGRIPWSQYNYTEDEIKTVPIVNDEFMKLLKDETIGGVTVGQNVANPKQYLVTLP
jgi:N-acetyl-anhydromuramyl-L-alanine amidase AmpD